MHNNMSHFSLKSLFGAVFLFFAFSFGLKAQDGAKIFKQNCAVCHSLTDQKLTGPGLAGVANRVPKPVDEWLTAWIKNNNKVIASGDAYAKTLVANNGGTDAMSEFEFLSDADIKALIEFVKAPPAPKVEAKTTAAAGDVVEEENSLDVVDVSRL